MVTDKPTLLFDTWDLLEKNQKLSNKDAFEALLEKSFDTRIIHDIRMDFPKSIPLEIGDAFHLKNKFMASLAPEGPYISYSLGTAIIQFIQSELSGHPITFSLLNVNNTGSKSNNFVRFLNKFNVQAKTYTPKRPSNFFGLMNKKVLPKEHLSFSDDEIKQQVLFLWKEPTQDQFTSIRAHWMKENRPFIFLARKHKNSFYSERFEHPELGDYCLNIVCA
jgi:hypothetical protein